MNILREVRRVSNKSLPIRIILLLAFCVIFVVTTYAWFSSQKDVSISGIEADVNPWYVAYYVKGEEVFEKVMDFTINELYPGMPLRTDEVHIYNIGASSTGIEYELVSVKVFGQEVLNELDIEITTDEETGEKTYTIFSEDSNYPFKVSYTYDKTYIEGEYSEENPIESAHATFHFDVRWLYEGTSEDDAENLARDVLDTKFGKDAYAYYNAANSDPSKAIEVKVRIKSSIHTPALGN